MSTEELQIAERARRFKGQALTNLQQFITEPMLADCFKNLNRGSSAGVDGKLWCDYDHESGERLPELLSSFKSGKYRAPFIRRVYIPKGKTDKRPLGIPTIEDKVLQEGIRRVLTPIYEEDFRSFSYGFRTGRSCHQAIDYMFKEVSFKGLHYIIDADIKNYFGSIDHGKLREFLDLRVKDSVVRKMIDKWLKAGILDDKQLHYPEEGTPQGGLVSPLLSNIYLHYVLDEWFLDEIQPLLQGKSFIVRYADDFVLGFENKYDADRVMSVLPKRFGKYKLVLHPEKTKIINLNNDREGGDRSFDFLGFTHYLSNSRKGMPVLKRKTSKKKFRIAVSKTTDWIKKNRHISLQELITKLNTKLVGHYNYYGITFNSNGIYRYHQTVVEILFKWINRRGGKRVWNWKRFSKLIREWHPVLKPNIRHSYV